MHLSEPAKTELKAILLRDFGDISAFSDEDIENLGIRLLRLTATAIKWKLEQKHDKIKEPD